MVNINLRNYIIKLFLKAKEHNENLVSKFVHFSPFLLSSLLTGIIAFLYSKLFFYSEKLSSFIFEYNKDLLFVSTPICFTLSWWLVYKYAQFAQGSGIPQVMAAIELSNKESNHLITKLLSFRIMMFKIISSSIKVIGGGIAGREGPTIQIASSVFLQIHKWFNRTTDMEYQKNILIAGASSGLAAAFNTPLGGIIFAIEELSKYHINQYKSTLFIAVIIAGLTAQGIGGSYLYLGYPSVTYSGFSIYLALILVSIICGYFGTVLCKTILKLLKFVLKIKNISTHILISVTAGLIVATLGYFLGEEVLGTGKTLMERVLFSTNKDVSWYIPFARMIGLISTFSFGGAGGVFAPSLSIGASFGALIADLFNFNIGNTDLLILVGMTSFLTGVTRAPFTSAIIIFEMTDRHSIIFFLLLSGLTSNLIASSILKTPFYEILKNNYVKRV